MTIARMGAIRGNYVKIGSEFSDTKSGQPVVTEIANYQTKENCITGITTAYDSLRDAYGKTFVNNPGTFFCVLGTPIKR